MLGSRWFGAFGRFGVFLRCCGVAATATTTTTITTTGTAPATASAATTTAGKNTTG